jgi:hypothetical protein
MIQIASRFPYRAMNCGSVITRLKNETWIGEEITVLAYDWLIANKQLNFSFLALGYLIGTKLH